MLGVDFSNKSRNLQIGSYLQTLRQEQEYTLEQLSVLSQVPVVHLTSIEEGRFSRFDEFYLKLYLKRFTGSLDVDLEQLYTYATQQPLPDDLSESELGSKQDERQMTEMQANISATPKSTVNTSPQRNPNLKVANIASLENKKRIIKLVTGLVLIIILIIIVGFIVAFIQDLADRDPTDDDTLPTIVENPHDINGEGDEEGDSNGIGEEDLDDDDEEEEPEPDPEPDPADVTNIELETTFGNVQTFNVKTELDEINLRVEHSGENWIGPPLNDITSDTFEAVMEPNSYGNVVLNVGAIHNIEAIYINDVEVEFDTSVPPGTQDFIFVIEFD